MEGNKLILVSGDGRNVGKTTLICELIAHLSNTEVVTAIKLSGHKHQTTAKQKLIFSDDGLFVYEELDTESKKDSTRFLKAGAATSYFVLANEQAFPKLVDWINATISGLIVCESRSLGNHVVPYKAFFVESNSPSKNANWKFPYQITRFENEQFEPRIGILLQGVL